MGAVVPRAPLLKFLEITTGYSGVSEERVVQSGKIRENLIFSGESGKIMDEQGESVTFFGTFISVAC